MIRRITMSPTKTMQMQSPSMNDQTSRDNDDNTNHDNKIMGKLLDSVMTSVRRSYPALRSVDNLRGRIEKQLNELLPTFKTPDHPPYALMIRQAIEELNEERGSSEESISKFIKSAYEDLPWGHSSLLKHHLKKLNQVKEILCVSGNRYVLPSFNMQADGKCSIPATPEPKQSCKKRHHQMQGTSRSHESCRSDEEFLPLSKMIEEIKIQSLKEKQEENLQATQDGRNQQDQPVQIAEEALSRDPNREKEPEGSSSVSQEKVSAFGRPKGASQEFPQQSTVNGTGEEEQGITVEKQTEESNRLCRSDDVSNRLGKDTEFVENQNQLLEEQQPLVVVRKDESQGGQQVEVVKQSKPTEEQGNQVSCQKDQALLQPSQATRPATHRQRLNEGNLAGGKRQTDVMEEESDKKEQGDRLVVERHHNEQQVVISGGQSEGEKQLTEVTNRLVQQNGFLRKQVQEQEHQLKAINERLYQLEKRGGQEIIPSSPNPLFASHDLRNFCPSPPGKEKCIEFLKSSMRLQEEFNERTVRLQEEFNKRTIRLQEELLYQMTMEESSVHPTNNGILDCGQNAISRGHTAGLHQQLEDGLQVKAPVIQMIESPDYADSPSHQMSESQQLMNSNPKRLPEVDLAVLDNLAQRGGKRTRVSEHENPTGQELNSLGFSDVVTSWLEQFEKKIFNALRLPEPELGRSENCQQGQPQTGCQIGKQPLPEFSNQIHPVPEKSELCHQQAQGQQLSRMELRSQVTTTPLGAPDENGNDTLSLLDNSYTLPPRNVLYQQPKMPGRRWVRGRGRGRGRGRASAAQTLDVNGLIGQTLLEEHNYHNLQWQALHDDLRVGRRRGRGRGRGRSRGRGRGRSRG